MKYFLLILLAFTHLSFASWQNDSFFTRLHDKLAISGVKCQGGEVTASPFLGEWSDYHCTNREWMVIVDNVNRCSQGLCTEIAVPPIMARLKRQHSSEMFTYYSIIPTIPVTAEVRWILRRHWVRFAPNGEAEVVPKN